MTETIIRLSREYGGDRRWAIAGGGNTSVKSETHLSIKASGRSLGTLSEEGLVVMDRAALADLFERRYPDDEAERERRALADLMNARAAGQGELRPSVETLMHDVFAQRFVVHTHPTLVNALTCAVDGERHAREIFGDEVIWVPVVHPGYVLGLVVRDAVTAFRRERGREPWLMLLANHGLVVAGESEEEIRQRQRTVIEAIAGRMSEDDARLLRPSAGLDSAAERSTGGRGGGYADRPGAGASASAAIERWIEQLRAAWAEAGEDEPVIVADSDENFAEQSVDPALLHERLREPFSPDHLVYALRTPLILEGDSGDTSDSGPTSAGAIASRIRTFRDSYGRPPRVVIVPSLALFGVAPAEPVARAAAALCLDALLIARGAAAFGGYAFMPEEQIRFIEGWEVERFRLKQSEQGGG